MAYFLIGLDGATYRVINSMVQEGKLKNFKHIMDNGASGVLEATHPPSTFPGWASIATGMNPGKHGVYGFFNPEKRFPLVDKKISISEADYINKRLKSVPNLWDEAGKKHNICLINYPGTYPAKKINGVMVTGLLTPAVGRKKFTYPENVADAIQKAVPGYEIDAKFQVDKKKALENTNDVAKKRFRLLKHFMKKDFDVYSVVFTSLDRIQHYLWGEKEVNKHYELLDEFIGELITERKNDHFLFVSDHGFQKNEQYFHVNTWLINNGFLAIKSQKRFSRNSIMRNAGLNKKNILKILKATKLTGLLKLLPMKFKGVIPENNTSIEEVDVDWQNTKAYCTYSMENGIYINLKGREPNGVVNENDYEQVRNNIIQKIEKHNLKCIKKEEIYSGEYTRHLPDIIIHFGVGLKFNSCISDNVIEDVNHEKTEEPLGSHHIDGIFMAYGKGIAKKNLQPLQQVDVLPTFLHMLKMPVPSECDGRVVKEMFKKGSEFSDEVKKQGSLKRAVKGIKI